MGALIPKRIATLSLLWVFLFAAIAYGVYTAGWGVVLTAQAAVGINDQINIQGKVVNTDGTNVADGTYDFEFKIYDVSSAGTALWTETWDSGTAQVTVTDGIFQVLLGTHTDLPGSVDFNTDTLYISVNFNGDGEMDPRIRLGAVPQAFNADALDGVDSGSFLRSDTSDSFTSGTLTFDSGTTLDLNGDVSIADTTIILDGASTEFTATGNVTFNTDDLVINKSTGNITAGHNLTTTGDLTITGDDLFMTTNTSGFLLVADGTNYNPVDASGDVDISSAGVLTIQANSVALGTDTTGDYVATIAAGSGIATTGAATGEGIAHTISVSGITGSNIADDSLDYVDFEDTMDLDAALAINTTGFDVVWNEDGGDSDFRIEGDTAANLLFVDASLDRVGINTTGTSAGARFMVYNNGTAAVSEFENDGTGHNFFIRQNGVLGVDRRALYVYSDAINTSAGSALGYLRQDNASSTSDVLVIDNDGAGNALTVIDGGTTNFVIKDGGNVGIGTTGPDRVLDVLASAAPQLRLTQADGTVYSEFQTDSSGDLTVTTSGDSVTFTGDNVTVGGDLTISGDDLTMATNTSGHLLVADGTN
ncbi:MAG: hypothetical protein WD972_00205, partial [Candidatus Andersenbacteria bacterium]